MEELLSLLARPELGEWVLKTGLAVVRLLPLVFLVPLLGGQLVPGPVKLMVALMLAIVLSPTVLEGAQGPTMALSTGMLVSLALKESFIGLVMGFMVSLVFSGARMAGSIIDALRGQTMATVLDPSLSERSSPTSALAVQLMVVVFLALDGHHLLIQALAESFELVPVGAFPLLEPGLDSLFLGIVSLSARMFTIAVALSMPVIAVCWLVDATLGVLNRTAPQIQVFFLGMPVKALLGIGIVFLALPALVDLMTGSLTTAISWMTRSIAASSP